MVTDILFEGAERARRRPALDRWAPAGLARARACSPGSAPAGAPRAVGDGRLLAPPRHRARVPELPALREALPRHHRAARRLLAAARRRAGALRKLDLESEDARLRRTHREGPLLEGGARHLLLHRVRALPDPLPDLRHRQAAQPQGGEPDAPAPPRRGPGAGARRARPRPRRRGPRGAPRRSCPPLVEASCCPRPPSGPAPPAAGARPPARCSSRTCPRLVDLRRHQVLVESAFPEEAARVFKNIETQGNPWGIGSNRRAEWCEDLAIPRASEGGDFEWLFFVGCAGAFDDRQKKVSRAIVKILRAAGVKFAILGEEETCNGEAARRLGNEYLFQMQATRQRRAHERLRGEEGHRPVPALPEHHQERVPPVRRQLRGGAPHRAHRAAGRRGEARARRRPRAYEGQLVTFHDPCYLARWNGVTDAPRAALGRRARASRVLEMARNRRAGLLLRRRRRAHVARGEARHPHQPEPGRRGGRARSARRAAWWRWAAPSASPC